MFAFLSAHCEAIIAAVLTSTQEREAFGEDVSRMSGAFLASDGVRMFNMETFSSITGVSRFKPSLLLTRMASAAHTLRELGGSSSKLGSTLPSLALYLPRAQ